MITVFGDDDIALMAILLMIMILMITMVIITLMAMVADPSQ